MSQVCQTPLPTRLLGASTLSSFWSSCLVAVAFSGQSYSSGSLVCQQADKRQSPLHLPVTLAECGVRENLLAFAELLGKCCFGTAGIISKVLHPVLTSRKVMLSKPWGLLLSAGVLLASPRGFSQYQPPAATSATMMRARSRPSTTSATKLPEGFSAGRGNAVRLDPRPREPPPASAQPPGQL